MNYSCKGIALRYFKYSESSVIVKILTEEKGVQSFLIRGVNSKKSKSKLGLLRSLSLLNISVLNSNYSSLHYLKEISIASPNPPSERVNINLMLMFMAEVVLKALSVEKKDLPVFNFVWKSCEEIKSEKIIPENYSLLFLLRLSYFLGFYPNLHDLNSNFFNMEKGVFSKEKIQGDYIMSGENLKYFKKLLVGENLKVPKKIKEQLLSLLLDYYKLHHHELIGLTSHEVIKSLAN